MNSEEWTTRFAVMSNAYAKFSLEYCLDSLERLEVRQIDLWGGEPHFYPEAVTYADTRRLSRMLQRRSQEIVCLTPEVLDYPYNIAAEEPEVRERTWRYGLRCLMICEDMGIPEVLFGPGWSYGNQPKDEGQKRAAELLARLSEEAGRRKVRIATQHLTSFSSNLVNSADDLRDLLQLTGAENLEAVIDISILHGRGERVDLYWGVLGERIGRIHIMDGREGELSAHLSAGDGNLPLKEIWEQLETLGFTGGYTWEINGPQYQEDPEAAVRKTLEAMAGWQKPQIFPETAAKGRTYVDV